MIYAAIMIKLEDSIENFDTDKKGTILYKSYRRGIDLKPFPMLKFRTMIVGADLKQKELERLNEKNVMFKIKDDPRITNIGKFLRKYSIDELPQLFNVLKGDMSLVGPRPLPLDQFNPKDIRQHVRLLMLPGITGLWQIRGRSETSFERMIAWDLFYRENRSFWLDLKILLRTPKAVLKGRGAY
jgi:lipopolysaccharide/colanic/teichoic acid biosynthesis glycosyltransferase